MEIMEKGQYVLATKYDEGLAGDPWTIGFYSEYSEGCYYVVDPDDDSFQYEGFGRIEKISSKAGRWILANRQQIEAKPHACMYEVMQTVEEVFGLLTPVGQAAQPVKERFFLAGVDQSTLIKN
jgi:hypothetical protein